MERKSKQKRRLQRSPPIKDLRALAVSKGVDPEGMSKSSLIRALAAMKGETKKPAYKIIKNLGMKGKEGHVVEIVTRGKSYAKKQFRKNKSSIKLRKEVAMQKIGAKLGVSPTIKEFNLNEKYIIMTKLDKNLYDIMRKKHGQLSQTHQRALLRIFKKLDKGGVFHKDPNPLNFMFAGTKLQIIDYGFAEEIKDEKHGKNPNLYQMTLGLLIKFKSLFPGIICGVEYPILLNALPVHLQSVILQ